MASTRIILQHDIRHDRLATASELKRRLDRSRAQRSHPLLVIRFSCAIKTTCEMRSGFVEAVDWDHREIFIHCIGTQIGAEPSQRPRRMYHQVVIWNIYCVSCTTYTKFDNKRIADSTHAQCTMPRVPRLAHSRRPRPRALYPFASPN